MTISRKVANGIQKELEDCQLAKSQLGFYQLTDSLRQEEVKALKDKINLNLKKQKAWHRRKELWFIAGLAGGILITK